MAEPIPIKCECGDPVEPNAGKCWQCLGLCSPGGCTDPGSHAPLCMHEPDPHAVHCDICDEETADGDAMPCGRTYASCEVQPLHSPCHDEDKGDTDEERCPHNRPYSWHCGDCAEEALSQADLIGEGPNMPDNLRDPETVQAEWEADLIPDEDVPF